MATCWHVGKICSRSFSRYCSQNGLKKHCISFIDTNANSQKFHASATCGTVGQHSEDIHHNSEHIEYSGDEHDTAGQQPTYDDLYPGHIPTSLFQKTLLAAGSAVACIVNPARDDMICALGETTGPIALQYMRRKMMNDPVGKLILEDEPLITTDTISLPYLESLSENTFGKVYWRFLDKNGFSPDARRPVNFVDDRDLMYVMLRYRQLHDLTHALLDMPPNMLGEVVVKWFEAVQTGLPMCMVGALVGPVRLKSVHRQKYLTTYLPWIVRSAVNSKFLMAVYFEKHWEQDIDAFRKELNLEPSPEPLIKTGMGTVTK